jgi:DNA invertase Pin-like site-specific DNA recombinase
MARVGYGRVSTPDQNALVQHDLLTAAGCERIFLDEGVSGAKASRPQLDRCLEYLRPLVTRWRSQSWRGSSTTTP